MNISEKLTTIAKNQEKVYEAGKKSQYDFFWNDYQENGNRKNYSDGFAFWSKKIFDPKYDMVDMINADRMFYGFNSPKGLVDLVDLLEEKGKTLDFSKCTRLYYTFEQAYISRIGTFDMSSASDTTYGALNCTQLVTIEKLVISEKTKLDNYTFPFYSGAKLANINCVEGEICTNIRIANCPLTKASIENVVNALSNTTSGFTCTFNKNAKESAFTTDEWNSLIATKSNWTFSLA